MYNRSVVLINIPNLKKLYVQSVVFGLGLLLNINHQFILNIPEDHQ